MKRITILTGHYGSGKSEIAVNLAIDEGLDYLVDLDVVNPYFRSRSVRKLLEDNGVQLAESTIEDASGSDLPFISAKGSHPFVNKDLTAVYDLAGTKAGAKLMRQFDRFIEPADVDFLVVLNIYRMETADEDKIIRLIETLEGSAQLKVTGLINNTNLLGETSEDDLIQGENIIKNVARRLKLPIRYTFIEETVETNRDFEGENRRLIRHLAKKWL